jgi:chromosome segregation ATPase
MSLPELYKNQIDTIAMELAEVMTECGVAGAALDHAEGHQSAVSARVSALAGEREAIIARRREGRNDAADGASLALIQADVEGLQPILREASERVQAQDARRAALSARAAQLRAQIANVEAQAAREALVRHAASLDQKLLETINALVSVNRQVGHTGRPVWGPSPALYQALRGLAAQRGEL